MPESFPFHRSEPDDYFIDAKIELEFLIDAGNALRAFNRETIAQLEQVIREATAIRRRSEELRASRPGRG